MRFRDVAKLIGTPTVKEELTQFVVLVEGFIHINFYDIGIESKVTKPLVVLDRGNTYPSVAAKYPSVAFSIRLDTTILCSKSKESMRG